MKRITKTERLKRIAEIDIKLNELRLKGAKIEDFNKLLDERLGWMGIKNNEKSINFTN